MLHCQKMRLRDERLPHLCLVDRRGRPILDWLSDGCTGDLAMLGLMQRRELLISAIITHAARHHADAEEASHRDDRRVSRTTYAALERRARRLASVLLGLGVRPGDRLATLAMNSDRHLEAYYAISGIGAICHTINPRLAAEDICYIIEHAEDRAENRIDLR